MAIVLTAGAGSYSTDAEAAILDNGSPPLRNGRTSLRRVGDPLYQQIIIWSEFDMIRVSDPDQFERLEYIGTATVETRLSHVFRIHFRDIRTTVATLGSDPISTTNGSPVVRVTHTAHGYRTGDYVRFSGASTAGGLQLGSSAVHEFMVTYVSDNTYDVTFQTSVILSSPFAMTDTSAVVRVTAASHGLSTGHAVRFAGAVAVGGITIAGAYTVTVIDANTFDITHSSPATSTTSGGGSPISTTYTRYATSTATGGGSLVVATYNEFKIIANDPSFTYAEGERLALLAAPPIGKLPLLYRRNMFRVLIRAGDGNLNAGEGSFTLYATRMETRIAYNDLEESCFHEATHAAGQYYYNGKGNPFHDHLGWASARAADGKYIDRYADDNTNEDLAQSALTSYAILTHPERFPEPDRTLIANQIPNRIAFFRDVVFTDPVIACARVPVAAVVSKLPAAWIDALEDNTSLASHCRDVANLKVEALYSRPALAAGGVPDLYKFICNVCGRAHPRHCNGGDARPFWDVR